MGEGNTESSKNFERIWLPILVIFAVAVTCINLLLFVGSVNAGREKADAQIQRSQIAEAMQRGYAPESWPCDPQTDLRTSNLCAEWKGADAARDGANWTLLAFIVGTIINVAALIVVGLTFRETSKATKAAIQAADNAGATLKADRAWMTPSIPVVNCILHFDGGVNISGIEFGIQFSWNNTGRSPALNFRTVAKAKLLVNPEEPGIGASPTGNNGMIVGTGVEIPVVPNDLSEMDITWYATRKADIWFYSQCQYEDIHHPGVTRTSTVCWKIKAQEYLKIANGAVTVRAIFEPFGRQAAS